MYIRSMRSLAIAAALVSGAAASGFAAAQSSDAKPGAWQLEATPYLWMSGLKGNTQAGSLPNININESFSDIVKVLDFGAMGSFEARKDRWGFLFDGIYMKLSDGMAASRNGPGPLGATATGNADVTIKQTMLNGGVAYRVLEGTTPVDVIGGLRYNKLDVKADFDARLFGPLGLNPSLTVTRSGDRSWTDGVVGVRVQHPFADRWTVTGYADAGGSSGSSTWQLAAGVSYDYSKYVSFKFGYRAMKLDYNKNGFVYDVTMQGPYIAAGFRF